MCGRCIARARLHACVSAGRDAVAVSNEVVAVTLHLWHLQTYRVPKQDLTWNSSWAPILGQKIVALKRL